MTALPLHLLVVDDHAIVRRVLVSILEGAGHGWRVSEADGGRQALALLRAQPVDFVVLDLSMPDMSGLELLHHIRAEFGRLPALVLSMHAEQAYAQRALECGADGYIAKDRADAELVPAVCRIMATPSTG